MTRLTLRSTVLAATAAATLALAGCASDPYRAPATAAYPAAAAPQPYPGSYPANYQNPVGEEYGRVTNIEAFQAQGGRHPSGVGAILGGVVGAVVGHQVGGGTGRVLATGAGAVGGAVAGNMIESRRGANEVVQTYRITVQTDNGMARAYDVPATGELRVGDRVRILQGGQLQRM